MSQYSCMFPRQPWTQLSRTHKAPHLNCTCRQAGPSSARLGLEVESEKAQPPKAWIPTYLTKMRRKAVVERGSEKTAPPELNLEFRDKEFGTTGGHEGRKVSAAGSLIKRTATRLHRAWRNATPSVEISGTLQCRSG